MKTETEQEKTVSDYLKEQGITYGVFPKGERTRDDWQCDAWSVSFQKGDGREALEDFDFFTGLAHRAEATREQKQMATMGFPGLNENDKKGKTSYGRRYLAQVEKMRKPVAPFAASVLYGLLLDSQGAEQNFLDWCSEYGYDSDSRKAFATYEACCENRAKLYRVFNREQVEHLAKLLEDY